MKVKFMAVTVALVLVLSLVLALAGPVSASPIYDVSGTWNVNLEYLSVNYTETLVLTQTGGNITGVSLNSVPPLFASAFTITGGSVSGNAIVFHASYNPNNLETMTFTGTIANSGSMSGIWADDPGFLGRTGTWAATKTTGTAQITGYVTAPSISITAPTPALDFGQFIFGVQKEAGPVTGGVAVVLGSATNINWTVTATDAAYGNGFMWHNYYDYKMATILQICVDGTNWLNSNVGATVSGTNNAPINFWAKQTAVTTDTAATYIDTVVFSVAVTSFN